MKTQRPIIQTLILALTVTTGVVAQPPVDSALTRKINQYSIAAGVGEFGEDWGVGVELTTRTIWANSLSLRARGNIYWLECYKVRLGQWATYRKAELSLVYHFPLLENKGRVYLRASPFALFTEKSYSNKTHVGGFAGAVGVELFGRRNACFPIAYYFSLGASRCKAMAEKLEGSPRFGEGINFNTGFRIYL